MGKTIEYPVRQFKDNMFIRNDGRVWAFYKVPNMSVSVTDTERKDEIKIKETNFLDDLKDFKNADISLLPKDMLLRERFDVLSGSYDEDSAEVAKLYAGKTVDALERELGMVFEYEWLVALPLTAVQKQTDFKSAVKFYSEKVVEHIAGAMNYEVPLSEDWQEEYLEYEDIAYRKMQSVNARKLSEAELMYLNRRNFVRNMPHTMLSEKLNRSVEDITNTIISVNNPNYLELESYEGKSYVALMPISKMPDNMAYCHLGESLQKLPFQVEFHMKLLYEEEHGVVNGISAKAKRANEKTKGVIEDGSRAGSDMAVGTIKNRIKGKDLKQKIEAGRPIVSFLDVVVVTGKTVDELNKRCDVVKTYLYRNKIEIVRAGADQVYLFHKCIMGEPLTSYDKNWVQCSTTDSFVEQLLFTTHKVGNNVGFYVGRVDNRLDKSKDRDSAIRASKNVVLFSPMVANKGIKNARTNSPHIMLTGETGNGKSFLMSTIFMYSSFLNMKMLFLDPKEEKRRQFDSFMANPENQIKYPELIKHIKKFHFISLKVENKENWGVLDPIIFLKGNIAEDVSKAMVYEIYDPKGKDKVETAISKEIKRVIVERAEGKKVGLLTAFERMKKSNTPEIADAGENIYEKATGGVLPLAFSNGERELLSFDNRITILEIAGLNLPKAGQNKGKRSEDEKTSLCLMYALGRFCEKFGSDNPEEETAVFFEEMWYLNSSAYGQKIIDSIKRVGRSQNNMMVGATQSVEDCKDEDGNGNGNIGTIFAFDEPKERGKILDHIGLEVNEKNLNYLGSMVQGQCIMLDMYRDIQKITVHVPHPEFVELFKTVEKTNASNAEEQYA